MRTVLCGGPALHDAARLLQLEIVTDRADVAILDLRDPAGLAFAAAVPAHLPRVVVADANARAIARALGVGDDRIVATCDPALLGPLVARAVPSAVPSRTRLVLVTGVRGGVGRTLLVVGLARRLATRHRVIALDVTGSGALAWWLNCVGATPWRDLEGLALELSADHLAVLVPQHAETPQVIGGPPAPPTVPLALATARAALNVADLVLVDAPLAGDERSGALAAMADRTLLVTHDDPVSRTLLEHADVPPNAWLVVSQGTARAISNRQVFYELPRDDGAIAAAAYGSRVVGGSLGRAYGDLADILALDAAS